jgi:hypothetical protein
VTFKVYWDNPPRFCKSCKEEHQRQKEERQRAGSSVANGPNSQARNAISEAGLSKYQQRKFHEALQREGGRLNYQQLVNLAYDIKQLYSGYR